jgi:hypothetical protein
MNARVRPSRASGPCRGWAAAVCVAGCVPLGAAAQADPAMTLAALRGAPETPVLEVTENAPRLELSEPGGSRVEATRWQPAGRVAYGVALGVTASPSALNPAATVLLPSVGLRFRSRVADNHRLDVATWQDLPRQREANFDYAQTGPTERLTTTRVEMQFAPPKGSGLGLDMGGAVGLQMSANSKLQLRIRKGGPMFYYRSKF